MHNIFPLHHNVATYTVCYTPDKLMNILCWQQTEANTRVGVKNKRLAVAKVAYTNPPFV